MEIYPMHINKSVQIELHNKKTKKTKEKIFFLIISIDMYVYIHI